MQNILLLGSCEGAGAEDIEQMIRIENVSKWYGDFQVLKNCSTSVKKGEVVVICGGTNDIAQNTGYISLPHILGNLVSMVELARANGIAPVLCSLLPAREFGWRKELEPAPLIIELNAMIREYARRENVPYVDYHAAMSEADGGMVAAYTYDEVHPTAAGYDVMEKILPPVVDAVLKNPKKYRRR